MQRISLLALTVCFCLLACGKSDEDPSNFLPDPNSPEKGTSITPQELAHAIATQACDSDNLPDMPEYENVCRNFRQGELNEMQTAACFLIPHLDCGVYQEILDVVGRSHCPVFGDGYDNPNLGSDELYIWCDLQRRQNGAVLSYCQEFTDYTF